jgi:3-hydroxypropanoate dehydrogenase
MCSSIDRLALAEDAVNLLFREARTANAFTDEPLPADILETIYDLVRWGPSSGNTQPLRCLAVRSPGARARLVRHMRPANMRKTESAPLVVVLAADTGFHDYMNDLLPYMENARGYFEADLPTREKGARFNATLQAGYFIMGVRAAGLAAGPMLGFDHEGVDAEFFPDGRLKSILVVNIGKPTADAWQRRLPRLRADQVITAI